MPDRITKVQRWLDLIAYLVGRRLPVSVGELMERLPAYAEPWGQGDEKARKSVRRKFERDKDELRELGIPIETVPYRIGALERPVHPYALVYGEGHWYLLAWCTVSEGVRIFRVDRILEVRVRYSPRIARWIAEREAGEWDADGAFGVTHQAADPHWAVRHVLQYGPDAVVLEPEEVRRLVREVVGEAKQEQESG